ncbi:hypothetical protein C8R44DRAFT_756541 [Mycena epipterygia]|nr:hypothetical protein C8R44DRAFT_756541 [Mycena epipterygia]
MILPSIVFLFFLPAVVRAQAPPTGSLINIKNFQGDVFDLAFASSAPLAPVQTLNHKSSEIAQGWVIEPAGTLFNVLNPFAGTFLSFSTAINGGNPTCAQVCGNPTIQTAWNITANANGFNIIEPTSHLAVMSWPASNSSIVGPTAPLTLQVFDPKEPQQIFSFPPFS